MRHFTIKLKYIEGHFEDVDICVNKRHRNISSKSKPKQTCQTLVKGVTRVYVRARMMVEFQTITNALHSQPDVNPVI